MISLSTKSNITHTSPPNKTSNKQPLIFLKISHQHMNITTPSHVIFFLTHFSYTINLKPPPSSPPSPQAGPKPTTPFTQPNATTTTTTTFKKIPFTVYLRDMYASPYQNILLLYSIYYLRQRENAAKNHNDLLKRCGRSKSRGGPSWVRKLFCRVWSYRRGYA